MASIPQIKETAVQRLNGSKGGEGSDFIAVEEPLEIRVEGRSIAVLMRTPGEDKELAAGFLVTEGILKSSSDIRSIRFRPHCLAAHESRLLDRGGNVIDVRLKDASSFSLKDLTRNVFTSSSCGVCSKATIKAVQKKFPSIDDDCEVDASSLMGIPKVLGEAQQTFRKTGGLHACGLFDLEGRLLVIREDVGRHNALDKVIGWALLQDRLPLKGNVLLLSGRTSFEMMQKALAAGVPIVAAISAPSSLAVEFAHDCGQTLVGFLREERMNVYAGFQRVRRMDRRIEPIIIERNQPKCRPVMSV